MRSNECLTVWVQRHPPFHEWYAEFSWRTYLSHYSHSRTFYDSVESDLIHTRWSVPWYMYLHLHRSPRATLCHCSCPLRVGISTGTAATSCCLTRTQTSNSMKWSTRACRLGLRSIISSDGSWSTRQERPRDQFHRSSGNRSANSGTEINSCRGRWHKNQLDNHTSVHDGESPLDRVSLSV